MSSLLARSVLRYAVPIALLAGCANELIDVRPGSQQIPLVTSDQVSQCQFKGNTTVSVLAQMGFISRSVEAINGDLLQLARNAALDAGGNTLVPGDRPELGKQTFGVYHCQRP